MATLIFRKIAQSAFMALTLSASAATLSAGAIIEERPIPFAVSDNFQLQTVNITTPLRSSFGEVIARGTYVVKIEGTGKPNEVLLNFSRSLGGPVVAKTKGSLTKARDVAAAPANVGATDPRHSFSNLGFTTLSQFKIGPDGPEQKITIESTKHALNYAIEAKLAAVQ